MSGFAGTWVDDVPAGEMENFEKFFKDIGLTNDEIDGYRGVKATQVTTVNGDDWSYTYEYDGHSKTNHFKINCIKHEDTDIEGNKFVMTTKFDANNPRTMIEETVTKRPNKEVSTVLIRTLNEAGDRQTCVITNTETGVFMKGDMIKK